MGALLAGRAALALWALAGLGATAPAFPPSAAQPVVVSALPQTADANTVAQAQRALESKQPDAALAQLKDAKSPAAALVRARALEALGKYAEASASLKQAQSELTLKALVALEAGKLAWAQGRRPRRPNSLPPCFWHRGQRRLRPCRLWCARPGQATRIGCC